MAVHRGVVEHDAIAARDVRAGDSAVIDPWCRIHSPEADDLNGVERDAAVSRDVGRGHQFGVRVGLAVAEPDGAHRLIRSLLLDEP